MNKKIMSKNKLNKKDELLDTDIGFMSRAIALAEKGRGRVSPNPLVGVVIVESGKVIGEGYHQRFGGPHAEVVALRDALKKAPNQIRESTMYVSLEPCSHHGKTPPCVVQLIEHGFARIVIGLRDPNPMVNGRSIRKLRSAGIVVRSGVLAGEVLEQNRQFIKHIATARPYVTLKLALSADGKLSEQPGKRTKITSEAQDKIVHVLRGASDAILVGSGTATADAPMLDVRSGPNRGKPIVRVVLDSTLQLSPRSKLVRTARALPLIVFANRAADHEKAKALSEAGARVITVRKRKKLLDLENVLDELGKRGIGALLVEGGNFVAQQFIKSRLVDELNIFFGTTSFSAHELSFWSSFDEAQENFHAGRPFLAGSNLGSGKREGAGACLMPVSFDPKMRSFRYRRK